MIEKADFPLNEVISILSTYRLAAAYLVPTPTGMDKSIMDATIPLKNYLRENKLHNFDEQLQGLDNKRIIEAKFILKDKIDDVTVSLYRPETKSGDPRLWIYGLNKYAKPYNLLVLFIYENSLFIFNASDPAVLVSIHEQLSPLGKLALRISGSLSHSASELLSMLKAQGADNFIPSVRDGDTGVGATLESILGIKANNKRTPDYKGIEIKASRQDPRLKRERNRVNLFSQVPNWKESPIRESFAMLREYGYIKDNRLQLYCTLDGLRPNSQGLMISVDEATQVLKAIQKLGASEKSLMVWTLIKLKSRLAEKHPESFWVKAETKMINGREHFRYYKIIHTAQPILSNLEYLLSDGTVSLDLTMSQKTDNSVRDHGYLFKIWPKDFNSLFPTPLIHNIFDIN